MMGGLVSGPKAPAAPQPVQQPVALSAAPEIEQRDVSEVDRIRRRKQQASLFDLLQDGGQSPTIL